MSRSGRFDARSRGVLARYTAGGALDATFGAGGRVTSPLLADANSLDQVVVLSSGKIHIAWDGFLARFNADGSTDTTFGAAGRLALGMTSSRVLVQADGRLLIAGVLANGLPASSTVTLLRFSADGGNRQTLGQFQRTLSVADNFHVEALLRQSDGKYVVPGTYYDGTFAMAAIRFAAGGAVDAGYGDGGRAIVRNSAFDLTASGAALAPDGRLVMIGMSTSWIASTPDYATVHLTLAGTPDPTFGGGDGFVTTDFAPDSPFSLGFPTDVARAVVVMPDGRVIVAGKADTIDARVPASPPHQVPRFTRDVIGIARYNPDGSPDNSFGQFGTLRAEVGIDSAGAALLLTPDGKLIVGGSGTPGGSGDDFALLRLSVDDPHPISAAISGGVLTVTGTAAADDIRLRTAGGRVEIAGVRQTFASATFSKIVIRGLGANDTIDASGIAGVAVDAHCGDGDDVILGGTGADSLAGGAGRDTLFGGRGADTLRGGDGRDYLNGGPGADRAFGDAGDDQIFARDGAIDTIDGGGGFDRVKGDEDDVGSNVEGLLA